MAEKNRAQKALEAIVPRREPGATSTEELTRAAQARNSLVAMHPAMRVAQGYFDKLMDKLDDMRPDSKTPSIIRRERGQGQNTGGAPADVICEIGGPPVGTAWEIMRLTTEVGGGAATVARFYLDDPTNATMKVAKITDSSDADVGVTNIYVPGGRKLIARFLNVAVGQPVFVALQVREYVPPEAREVPKV